MALAGSGVVATSTSAFAEETAAADVPSLQTFDASDFEAQAADLPSGLKEAIERDLGIKPAEYLANAEAGKIASHAVSALGEAGVKLNGAEFDPAAQDLTVYLGAEIDVPVVEGIGAKVVVGDAPDTETPDYEFAPYADFKGGYGYVDPDSGRCSAGFNGFDAAGDPAILTAGHCNPTSADVTWLHIQQTKPWSPAFPGTPPDVFLGDPVGQGGVFQFGEGQDAGLFPAVNDGSWTYPAEVSNWGGSAGDPTDGSITVTDNVDPLAGLEICRSGASSGYQCGSITDVNQEVPIGDPNDPATPVVTGFFTTACGAGGDSGGSFLAGTAAVGTLTGGPNVFTPDPDDACSAGWESDYRTVAYAVSGSATSATEFYGDAFELKVAVATPTVTSPEDGAETGPTPTIEGTVEGASANHTAYVTIDGDAEYSAALAANGSFSVPVADALEVGDHDYEVVVGYGDYSRSEAASGSFTVGEGDPVAPPAVTSPENGQTTDDARPSFTGTGQPGAGVVLTVGEDELGSAVVSDGGDWTIEPESDLPVAERFDAVLTQTAFDDVQSVTVSDLGVRVQQATITNPKDGSEAPADLVFEGTAQPGSDLSITLTPAGAEEEGQDTDATTFTALSEGGEVAPMAEGDDDVAAAAEVLEGEWTFEGNAWTFTPSEPLPEGDYTVTFAAQFGDDPELGASEVTITFTATPVDDGGDAGGGDDDGGLPDTGSSTTPLIIGAIVLLLAGGAAMVAVRARRNGSAA